MYRIKILRSSLFLKLLFFIKKKYFHRWFKFSLWLYLIYFNFSRFFSSLLILICCLLIDIFSFSLCVKLNFSFDFLFSNFSLFRNKSFPVSATLSFIVRADFSLDIILLCCLSKLLFSFSNSFFSFFFLGFF